ncbi:transmembrane BAX inhibitor motif containing 1a isoform X4 [Mobula hypostoma]|uniref:transmembrane BAX inhibitor motif containing 1a isoform X4 n=1 Tax=Mobula hypostoma TaxID=723540 RepID=UPI002FC2DBD9
MTTPSAPPSYEESVDPLYPPPHGAGYPASRPYPPNYGPAYPPGESLPYPPAGNAGYPSSFPQPGPPMGPPMMPTLPLNPTWPGGNSGPYGSSTSNPEEGNEGFTASSWDDRRVRHAFIRKVYLILTAQLFVTFGIVAVFTFSETVQNFVQKNSAIYWAAYAVFFVVYIVLVCCEGPRRKFPWNVILLAIFTLAMSYMTGMIASFYNTRSVFLCFGITGLVCLGVTVFCFQTKISHRVAVCSVLSELACLSLGSWSPSSCRSNIFHGSTQCMLQSLPSSSPCSWHLTPS